MKHKILFLGTPDIAVPSLEAIHQMSDMEIVGVGVFPDRKVGRKQILTPSPVKKRAQALNLPIIEISKKEDLEALYMNINFDLGIVIAFGIIFPETILKDGKFVNVHFSLLPKYRGASPVQSAILNGDQTSGITWQRMVKKLDAGQILYQKKQSLTSPPLGETERAEDKRPHRKSSPKVGVKWLSTAQTFSFFAQATAQSFPQFLHDYFEGKLQESAQNEAKSTFCGKFEKPDGKINPETETAEIMYRKYLAFDLWPGIFLETKKGSLKIKEASLKPMKDSFRLEGKNQTAFYIQKAQLPGKIPMPMMEILKGHPNLLDLFL